MDNIPPHLSPPRQSPVPLAFMTGSRDWTGTAAAALEITIIIIRILMIIVYPSCGNSHARKGTFSFCNMVAKVSDV